MDDEQPKLRQRKTWDPVRYTNEPEPAFQSTDTEPMDYSKGPHDSIIGEIKGDDEEEDSEGTPPAPEDQG